MQHKLHQEKPAGQWLAGQSLPTLHLYQMFHSFGKMDFTEISVWINGLRNAVRIPKLIKNKIRIWRKNINIQTFYHLDIPSDWQNTLTKKYPTLKKSSVVVSSQFESSNTDNDDFTTHVEKTSTPIKPHHPNRIRGRKQQSTLGSTLTLLPY